MSNSPAVPPRLRPDPRHDETTLLPFDLGAALAKPTRIVHLHANRDGYGPATNAIVFEGYLLVKWSQDKPHDLKSPQHFPLDLAGGALRLLPE